MINKIKLFLLGFDFSGSGLIIRGVLIMALYKLIDLYNFSQYASLLCGSSSSSNGLQTGDLITGSLFIVLYFLSKVAAPAFILSGIFLLSFKFLKFLNPQTDNFETRATY